MLRQPPMQPDFKFDDIERFSAWLFQIIEKGRKPLTKNPANDLAISFPAKFSDLYSEQCQIYEPFKESSFYQLTKKLWKLKGNKAVQAVEKWLPTKRQNQKPLPQPHSAPQETESVEQPNHRTYWLSVIIPSYNMKAHIGKCIESILAQPERDQIQILVIDDASGDGTGILVNQYFQKNPNVKYIRHEKNLGVSRSRNDGIRIAEGQYIHCVDADDVVPMNAYSHLLKDAMNVRCDIGTGNFKIETGASSYIRSFSGSTGLARCLDNNNLSLWNKLFRRDFLLENNLFCDESMKTAEDVHLCIRAYRMAKNSFIPMIWFICTRKKSPMKAERSVATVHWKAFGIQ